MFYTNLVHYLIFDHRAEDQRRHHLFERYKILAVLQIVLGSELGQEGLICNLNQALVDASLIQECRFVSLIEYKCLPLLLTNEATVVIVPRAVITLSPAHLMV